MNIKLYTIEKVFITEGLIDTETEIYNTEKERDGAWNVLIHDHNEMVRESFGINLNKKNYEKEYHYEWNDNMLEFYCRNDVYMHRDFFKKSSL